MQTTELIAVLGRGEDSRHQFKADFTNGDALAAEMVAFSNTAGGRMFIGVRDDGTVCGLAAGDVARLNQLLSNAASQNVRPPVNPLTEIVTHPDGNVLVVVISREELQRIFQQGGLLHADEILVPSMTLAQVNVTLLDQYLEKVVGETLDQQGLPLGRVLENMNLAQSGSLNLAGALLFGRHPETRLPAFIVKAVAFPGTDIADDTYLESRDLTGPLSEIFEQGMRFLMGNTRTLQKGRSVNSLGEPEVPWIVWEELLANALVHRDYFVSAPVRVLVFADRVEIISPGHLPNNLTIENIKAGNSNIRNPILASFAAKLLPYRGLGSGLLRAFKAYPAIELIDDRAGNLFKAIVTRPDLVSPDGAAVA